MTCRTEGDGMENIPSDKREVQAKVRLGDTLIYHPTNLKQQQSIRAPVEPTGTVVNLTPKIIVYNKNSKEKKLLNSLKSKEPKFVPYEPYKAAINPIVPLESRYIKSSKNNADVNTMVKRMINLRATEIETRNPAANKTSSSTSNDKETGEWALQKKAYEAEIQKLKDENNQLETQLKFQAQVHTANL